MSLPVFIRRLNGAPRRRARMTLGSAIRERNDDMALSAKRKRRKRSGMKKKLICIESHRDHITSHRIAFALRSEGEKPKPNSSMKRISLSRQKDAAFCRSEGFSCGKQ